MNRVLAVGAAIFWGIATSEFGARLPRLPPYSWIFFFAMSIGVVILLCTLWNPPNALPEE